MKSFKPVKTEVEVARRAGTENVFIPLNISQVDMFLRVQGILLLQG